MKIYLGGGITGVPNYFEKFAKAADNLRAQGHVVFNPASANLDDGRQLWKIMAYLIPQLCESEALALLPKWWRSGGARIEWMLARYIGLTIIYL